MHSDFGGERRDVLSLFQQRMCFLHSIKQVILHIRKYLRCPIKSQPDVVNAHALVVLW